MDVGRKLIVALVVAVGAGVLAAGAAADRPVKTAFTGATFTSVMSGVCAFDVQVDSTASGFEIDHFDRSGAITMVDINEVEQDVFSANGKTLTGIPYTFNLQILFDSAGVVTHAYASGNVSKVPLPDGSVFHSAGRVDFLAHPGAAFLLSPDKGNPGNVAGFCAALAP